MDGLQTLWDILQEKHVNELLKRCSRASKKTTQTILNYLRKATKNVLGVGEKDWLKSSSGKRARKVQSECGSFDNRFELEPSSSSLVSGSNRTAKHKKHLKSRASPNSSAGVSRYDDLYESTSKISAGFRDSCTQLQAQSVLLTFIETLVVKVYPFNMLYSKDGCDTVGSLRFWP